MLEPTRPAGVRALFVAANAEAAATTGAAAARAPIFQNWQDATASVVVAGVAVAMGVVLMLVGVATGY